MGKECGAWISRRLWGGGNTSPLKTTAWEATRPSVKGKLRKTAFSDFALCFTLLLLMNS